MKYITLIPLVILLILIITALAFYIHHSYHHDLHIKPNTCNDYCQKDKYNNLQLKGLLSDKIKVKEYLSLNHPNIKFAKLLYKTKDPSTLSNYPFPEKFVLKNSAGSRMSKVFSKQITSQEISDLIYISQDYLKTKFSTYGYRKIPFFGFEEPHYDYNDPHIMIEEYIPNTEEFRILMVEGKIIYYDLIIDGSTTFDKEWNRMKVEIYDDIQRHTSIQKPKKLREMEEFCYQLYSDTRLNFMRVDFMITKDDFYFGEVTFTPDNCRTLYSDEYNNKFKEIIY